jgi:hypothetical protein
MPQGPGAKHLEAACFRGTCTARPGSCPTQAGELELQNKGITSVSIESFAGMGACK